MGDNSPMDISLNENQIKRLALVKYLYRTALEQSKQPEPMCSFSILIFHDAIELFLILASEVYDVKKSEQIMEYWERFSSTKNVELTQKESVRRLVRARYNLKHQGLLPSKLEIEGFRATATNFFEENTPRLFGKKFSEISLASLVSNTEVRNHLMLAEKFMNKGDKRKALKNIYAAYWYTKEDFRGTGLIDTMVSVDFNDETSKKYSDLVDDIKSNIDKIERIFNDIAEILSVVVIGVDYFRYAKFKKLTQDMNFYPTTKSVSYFHTLDGSDPFERYSDAEIKFCFDFVVDFALTIQQKIYDRSGEG